MSRSTVFFKGISIQTIITIVMGVMEIVVFAIMSRLLSKTDFGYYATITALVSIFASIAEAGLGSAVIQKKDASPRYLGTAYTLSVILGVIMASLLFLLAPIIAKTISDATIVTPLRIMSGMLFLNSIISIGRGLLMRKFKFLTIGVINIVSYLVSSVVGVILAYNGYGLYAIVISQLLNVVICTILILCYSYIGRLKFVVGVQEAKDVLSFGGWLTLGVILNSATQQVDKLLLPRLISTTALGAYNRPAGFVNTITDKINGIFDTILFPTLSDLQDNHEMVKNILYRSVSLLNSVSVVIAAAFFFNAELIISIFFGEEWLNLVPILRIVAISSIFNIDSRLVDCFFRSLAFVKLGFYIRLFAAILIFISIIIGSKFGIIGVALALMISNICVILIKLIWLAKKIKAQIYIVFSTLFVAMKPIIPIAAIGIPFLLFIDKSNIINLIIFAILFTVIVFYEFICNPNCVGEEYVNTVYPHIDKILKKCCRNERN